MNTLSQASEPAPSADQVRWFVAEVHPHESALKSWLRARFPRLIDVDDIAQIAFMRLWRRHSKPDSEAPKSPKAALFAIARNAAIDEVRHRQVTSADTSAAIELLPGLDHDANVVESVTARQELEFLAKALRDLPPRARQVMTLAKIYGLTEREVAAQLGISENTVRTHIVRSMVHCTEYLRRHGVCRNPNEGR